MKAYYLLYLPAVIFFSLPIINLLVQESKAKKEARQKEERRRAAAEMKAAEKARRDAKKERAAELKKAERESKPKRKPGRPRKNPAAQRPETILKTNTPAAPVRASDPVAMPAPLPTSCTPEQFAAWIK